jgi:arsenate reductase (thioredoxin)
VDAAFREVSWRDAAAYLPARVAGCIVGAIAANLMFAPPAVTVPDKSQATPADFLSEVIATLGLILVIFALARSGRIRAAPSAVGAYTGAAYFFTSSASFANPEITIGPMFSHTFAGIAPASAPSFIGAQIAGGYSLSSLSRRCIQTSRPGKPQTSSCRTPRGVRPWSGPVTATGAGSLPSAAQARARVTAEAGGDGSRA